MLSLVRLDLESENHKKILVNSNFTSYAQYPLYSTM